MVELRKRKAPAETAAAPPTKKGGSVKAEAAPAKVKDAVGDKKATPANGASLSGKVSVGNTINLEHFGEEVETNDGEKTTLKKLVEESKTGVVLFTYPKASTPGCTTQACLFRDEFTPLTATGFSIYGLSTDSPKSNTTFKTKQNLPYTLLCDPSATLIGAIGMKKAPKGTARGVFVVNKEGTVLAVEAGGPGATVEVVRKLVKGSETEAKDTTTQNVETTTDRSTVENGVETDATGAKETDPSAATNGDQESKTDPTNTKEDIEKADVAADVADSAEKLDKRE